MLLTYLLTVHSLSTHCIHNISDSLHYSLHYSLTAQDVYPVKGGDEGSSARLFGEALALTPGLREQLTLVAKMDIIFPTAIDTSREHLLEGVNFFLQSLGG